MQTLVISVQRRMCQPVKHRCCISEYNYSEMAESAVCCSQLILCSMGQVLTKHMHYLLHNALHNMNKESRIIWKETVLLLPSQLTRSVLFSPWKSSFNIFNI